MWMVPYALEKIMGILLHINLKTTQKTVRYYTTVDFESELQNGIACPLQLSGTKLPRTELQKRRFGLYSPTGKDVLFLV